MDPLSLLVGAMAGACFTATVMMLLREIEIAATLKAVL